MSNYLWKSSPATTFYRFYDLPRELRDIIHGYAFGTAFGTDAETFKVVLSRSEWMNRENRRRSMAMWTAQLHRTNTSYEIRRYPRNPLEKMIVSKQFYSEAVKVWTEQNTFEFQNSRDLKDFISECKPRFLSNIRKIRTGYGAKYSHAPFCDNISLCTGLDKLVVVVNQGTNLFDGKSDYTEELDERDFHSKNLDIVRDICNTSSIQSVELLPGKHDFAESPSEHEQFRRNLDRLTAHIMIRLRAHHARASQQAAPGSNVLGSSSSRALAASIEERPGVGLNEFTPSSWKCRAAVIQARPERIAQRAGNANGIGNTLHDCTRHGNQSYDGNALESQLSTAEAIQPTTPLLQGFRVPKSNVRLSKKEAIVGTVLLMNTMGTAIAFYLAATL